MVRLIACFRTVLARTVLARLRTVLLGVPVVVAATVVAAIVATSAAVEAGAQEQVVFAGQVVDTYLGQPVSGALIVLPDARKPDGSTIAGVTDESGRFSISDVPTGPSEVAVSRLGYAELAQVLDIQDGLFVEVALIPKPLVLEGIEVYVDRLESRLRSVPFSSNTHTETDLRFSPDLNVADYLDSRPGFSFVPCFDGASGSVFTRQRDCIRTRGVTPQRPKVFIDDAPAFGGVQELATLPTTEVYRVEVIRGCAQIRVYTIAYSEGTASNPRPLLPIVC